MTSKHLKSPADPGGAFLLRALRYAAGMKGALILLLCLSAATAVADDAVYRFTDANGVTHYTDRPPDRHAKPIHLAPLSGPPPVQHQMFYSPEALREAARFAVRVESPTPGERLDQGAAPLIAAASVMPALVTGFHLVYQVDEHAVTTQPVDALSIALPTLTPGTHKLLVVLLDDHGRELARSAASSFEVRGTTIALDAPKK